MNGLITFTPAQEEDERWLGISAAKTPSQQDDALSGEAAKCFYQSLLEEGKSGGSAVCHGDQRRGTNGGRAKRREPPRDTVTAERDGHRLLKCAQEGDLAGLKELLEKKGCDINFQDAYYWTPIMCASYAGQHAVVRFLLCKGAAWVGVVDSQGRDARDLADQAGHEEVVRELERFGVEQETPGNTMSVPPAELQWCTVCGIQYSDSEKKHNSSTVHQFSLRRPPPVPHYCLPPSNAAFRMMLREGWEPGAGLGPQGAGRTQPVRTVLKRDQEGLGYGPTPRARVTHFEARDTRAVQQVPATAGRMERVATLSRRAERRKEAKDKNWERNFRTYFNL
ncbi:G patch domain and ankyrin repeat-containing protein 1 [Scleropages formosus]|uniref:G patch domain and ankyrin repeats 1 n=1 Tax=Scleropages formosus TaxID=113540 RepID=A0A8C9W091_SCLFO|nr:G patch domain and ankyrin repeat-containing protein 1 [Scleropages formosus]XP_018586520.2 G patch domain and ankyrin repeat-containing protein 1 [Scleropages formosus]